VSEETYVPMPENEELARSAERRDIYRLIDQTGYDGRGEGLQMAFLRLVDESGELAQTIQEHLAHPGDSPRRRIVEEGIHVAAAAVSVIESAKRRGTE